MFFLLACLLTYLLAMKHLQTASKTYFSIIRVLHNWKVPGQKAILVTLLKYYTQSNHNIDMSL